MLPVEVGEKFLANLFSCIESNPQTTVEVNISEQTITNKTNGETERFQINGYKKYCLENGLDDIDFLVKNRDKVDEWERNNR